MLTPNTNRNGDLPADIILEILLRLPVKSLLRFKCVCKHWYSLIGSRDFVNRHFGHESNQERLLIQYCNPNEYLNTFAFVVDETCSAYEEHDLLQMPDSVYGLLGPVNGVFCVAGLSEEVALLNPAMRQFKPFSLPCPDVQPDLWPFKNVVGFGLDPLSGDYKLVQIQYFYNDEMDGGHDSALVSVYNSGSDSWRHFEDVALVNSSHCVYGSLCNTYLDGLCYWLMEFDNGNVAAILAFDMTTEKFHEIKVPDCIKWKTGRLALCGDSLTLLSYDMNMNDKFFDIWVMGEEGCWTRSSTVGPFQDIQWPLCFWKNNELLFETGSSQLILHNVFTQKLRTVDLERNENGFSRHWGFSYKESLVSIKREGDNCMLWDTSSDFVKYFFNLSSSNK